MTGRAPDVRVLPCGRDAVLVEVADPAEAVDLAAWVRGAGAPVLGPLVDVVPAARTVLLDAGRPLEQEAVRRALAAWRPGAGAPTGAADVVALPLVLDGPDLDDVAARWGTDRAGVADVLTGTPFTAAFTGFAPGFAYLAGLPEELAVPRLPTPRPRVPAGAVGLAGTWCGAYPAASPGGWRLVGRTTAVLWDVDRDPPALLVPGAAVRFVVAGGGA